MNVGSELLTAIMMKMAVCWMWRRADWCTTIGGTFRRSALPISVLMLQQVASSVPLCVSSEYRDTGLLQPSTSFRMTPRTKSYVLLFPYTGARHHNFRSELQLLVPGRTPGCAGRKQPISGNCCLCMPTDGSYSGHPSQLYELRIGEGT